MYPEVVLREVQSGTSNVTRWSCSNVYKSIIDVDRPYREGRLFSGMVKVVLTHMLFDHHHHRRLPLSSQTSYTSQHTFRQPKLEHNCSFHTSSCKMVSAVSSQLSSAASPSLAIQQESDLAIDPALLGTDAARIAVGPLSNPGSLSVI